MMYSVKCIAFCKCKNIEYTLVKKTRPQSVVTKEMYKQISNVHVSSVLTVIKNERSGHSYLGFWSYYCNLLCLDTHVMFNDTLF